MLVEGQISPGAKLNERELCELLGVSRTPLREAIKLLAAEGLARPCSPNRGAVAVKLGETDVLHTFEVLAGLEAQSGELAAERVTPEELAEIKAQHYEMLACFSRSDLSGYYRLNARIHAGNQRRRQKSAARENLSGNQRAGSVVALSHEPEFVKWRRAVKEHEQMIAALEARATLRGCARGVD